MIVFGDTVVTRGSEVKMRPLGWAITQSDWGLYQKRLGYRERLHSCACAEGQKSWLRLDSEDAVKRQ